jgi:hypothetical protein
MNRTLVRVLRIMLVIFGAIWCFVPMRIVSGVGIGLDPPSFGWWLTVVLLLVDGCAHFVGAWGLGRWPTVFSAYSIPLIAINALATISDQAGPWEVVLFIVQLAALLPAALILYSGLKQLLHRRD